MRSGAMKWPEVLQKLKNRQHTVRHVVVSGGEPTLHPGLKGALQKLRQLGFAIKLDTNGSQPQVLRQLLAMDLLDYVAMDAKGAPGVELDTLVCNSGYSQRWLQSLDALQNWNHDQLEIRTTIHSRLNVLQLQVLATIVPTDVAWYWQACRPTEQDPGNQNSAWAHNAATIVARSVRFRGFANL